jgi:YgiT-type zinc finger domain-containing protein
MNKCTVCQNLTERKSIRYTQEFEGELIAVENVPADICTVCGEQYFDPDVVDKLQKIIYLNKPKKKIEVALFDLSEI